jgi:uncharacterized membrane protein YphA (DoxX/SURF4 family)
MNRFKMIAAFSCIVLRIVLGMIFIFASYGKIINPYGFALSIASYQMLPLSVINIFAIIMPWLEMIAGILLVLGFRIRANALIINMMLVVFIIAISQALLRNLMLSDCGCFSSEDAKEEVSNATLVRDVIFLAMGLVVLIFDHAYFSMDYLINNRIRK